jgi:4-carboxymuconolactone decarboxylase
MEEPMRRLLTAVVLVMLASLAANRAKSGRSEQSSSGAGMSGMQRQASAAAFPQDVYANTGSRLPAIKREDLDDAGKKLFDSRGPTADAFGPGAIRLYSLPVADHMAAVNSYLRYKSGLDPRLVQLAILVTARESDSEYVWTAHEPQGLQAGLSAEVVDVVKYRKPTAGLVEKDAAIIDLGREVFEKHHVSSQTYARARSVFGNQELVNYAALMGDYAATTTLLNAFDQHIRPADKPLLPIP